MAEPAASALALARMRALGDAPASAVPAASAAARATGREIVTVTVAGAQVARLAWPADIDLTEQAGPSSLWAVPPTALQLTFAACVRLCWDDVHVHPYPGRAVPAEAVFALLARLNARPAADEAIPIFDNAPKRSLTWLRRTAWLGPDDADVRFGTRVAALSDDDVAALRRVHEAMPDPEETPANGTARPEPPRFQAPALALGAPAGPGTDAAGTPDRDEPAPSSPGTPPAGTAGAESRQADEPAPDGDHGVTRPAGPPGRAAQAQAMTMPGASDVSGGLDVSGVSPAPEVPGAGGVPGESGAPGPSGGTGVPGVSGPADAGGAGGAKEGAGE